jgi:predicted protein tyrosine phosphatase
VNWLFICSRNRLRSPTGEAIFRDYRGIETDSAGLSPDAQLIVERDQIEWADLILVMEPIHRARLKKRFGQALTAKRIVVLGIPDHFAFMDPELVKRLEAACRRYLS